MKQYSVTWSLGGHLQIPAESPEDARALMNDMLPSGPRDWVEVDVEETK